MGGLLSSIEDEVHRSARKVKKEFKRLTGIRAIERVAEKEEARLAKLQQEQEQADLFAKIRRENNLRAALTERQNLFSILGTPQGSL